MNPWHRARPRSGSPRMGTAWSCGPPASTNLGDLRPALGLLEGRRCGGHGSGGVLGQAQLQQVPGRHWVLAPDDNDLPEQVLEARGSLTVQRCFTAENATQE